VTLSVVGTIGTAAQCGTLVHLFFSVVRWQLKCYF